MKGKPMNISEESAFDKMDEDVTQEAMYPKKLHIKGTLRDISRHLRHKRENVRSKSKHKKECDNSRRHRKDALYH